MFMKHEIIDMDEEIWIDEITTHKIKGSKIFSM